MLALRVQEARCQNWRAWVFARSCVSSTRSGSAAHGGTPAAVGTSSTSALMLLRRNASPLGHMTLLPNPSAARW